MSVKTSLVLSFFFALSATAHSLFPPHTARSHELIPRISTADWTKEHSCIVDTSARILSEYHINSSKNTATWCRKHCATRGYTLAGVEAGQECYCGSSYNAAVPIKKTTGCSTVCTGDSAKKCGGDWKITVYQSPDYDATPLPQGGKVITSCVNPNQVALTFDDGPYQYLKDLSDQFTAVGGKATFFFNGNNYGCIYTAENIANIKYAYAAGHEMASHTWSHSDLATLTFDQIHDEMYRVELALSRIVGVVPAYFRPPFGSYNDLVVQVAQQRGQALAIWDFDSLDWQDDTQTVLKRWNTTLKADPSNLLVLHHETYEHTPKEIIPVVLKRLTKLGYELVTVSECMGTKAYQSVVTPGAVDGSWVC